MLCMVTVMVVRLCVWGGVSEDGHVDARNM